MLKTKRLWIADGYGQVFTILDFCFGLSNFGNSSLFRISTFGFESRMGINTPFEGVTWGRAPVPSNRALEEKPSLVEAMIETELVFSAWINQKSQIVYQLQVQPKKLKWSVS